MARRRMVLLVAIASLAVVGCGSAGPPPATASPSAATPSAAVGTASPSPTPTSLPQGFRVAGLDVRADPADYSGPCPAKIAFSATISVAGGGGSVSYRWLSSDGDTSPVKTLTFATPGSQDVSSSWTVDQTSVPTGAGWSSVEIVGAVGAASDSPVSARAPFTFGCDDSGFETIGFGIGGSDADCSLARTASTFAPTDRVRMVADYSPSLPAGTVVTFRLYHDGVLVDGYPVTLSLTVSTKCLHGNVSQDPLPAGHYRLDVAPDSGRPAISGEFDTK